MELIAVLGLCAGGGGAALLTFGLIGLLFSGI